MSRFKQAVSWLGNKQTDESVSVETTTRHLLASLSGSGVSWIHVALNYFVPYCVASYSAAKNELMPRGHQ